MWKKIDGYFEIMFYYNVIVGEDFIGKIMSNL